MKFMSSIVVFSSLAVAAPSIAANLSTDSRITNDLTAAAVGDEIRNNCPSISANMFTAMGKAMSLKRYAKSLGATDEDIDNFLKNESEQNRIRRLRDRYLKNGGVVVGDAQSYCKLGEAEINKGSLIGSLLRKR